MARYAAGRGAARLEGSRLLLLLFGAIAATAAVFLILTAGPFLAKAPILIAIGVTAILARNTIADILSSLWEALGLGSGDWLRPIGILISVVLGVWALGAVLIGLVNLLASGNP